MSSHDASERLEVGSLHREMMFQASVLIMSLSQPFGGKYVKEIGVEGLTVAVIKVG